MSTEKKEISKEENDKRLLAMLKDHKHKLAFFSDDTTFGMLCEGDLNILFRGMVNICVDFPEYHSFLQRVVASADERFMRVEDKKPDRSVN